MPEIADRGPNRAPWLALVFAIAALLSNAGFFVAFPGQRALAWLGVALVIAAVVCAVIGMQRAFRESRKKVSSSILGVLSLLLCAFTAFIAINARNLPQATAAPQVGQKAPDFTLADTSGNQVSLGQLLGRADAAALPHTATAGSLASGANPNAVPPAPKAVLLVFYRGYW